MKPIACAAALTVPLLALSLAYAGETLKVVEHPKNEITTHVGKGEDNPGDLLTFANAAFDATNQKQVAHDQGFCIRVVPGKSWECFWTLIMPAGQITVEGPYMDSGDSHLTITGGTGKYAGAKGSMTLRRHDTQSDYLDFIYELL